MTHTTAHCPHDIGQAPVGILELLGERIGRWISEQHLKSRLADERGELLSLSDEVLKDIGISRAQAEVEARRKDIPAMRRGSN